jgi:hypothetical protein
MHTYINIHKGSVFKLLLTARCWSWSKVMMTGHFHKPWVPHTHIIHWNCPLMDSLGSSRFEHWSEEDLNRSKRKQWDYWLWIIKTDSKWGQILNKGTLNSGSTIYECYSGKMSHEIRKTYKIFNYNTTWYLGKNSSSLNWIHGSFWISNVTVS